MVKVSEAPAGLAGMFPPTERRVPAHTSRASNAHINNTTMNNLKLLATASPQQLTERIHKLQYEWDIERTLEMNASTLIVVALLLVGLMGGWIISGMLFASGVAAFLLQHALQRWCPPLPVFRKLGFRTSYEIMDELVALRFLRGDFDSLAGAPAHSDGASSQARRSEMLDSMISNMKSTGRLLGHF